MVDRQDRAGGIIRQRTLGLQQAPALPTLTNNVSWKKQKKPYLVKLLPNNPDIEAGSGLLSSFLRIFQINVDSYAHFLTIYAIPLFSECPSNLCIIPSLRTGKPHFSK